ncbi:MAG: hypothetical protein ACYDE0_07445 [Acidiferrobacterales bacterium]
MAALIFMAWNCAHAAVPRSVRAAQLYAGLAKAKWIAFGHGPKILYDVFDPNCPYCYLLWNKLKPLIGPDHLTVRVVPLGYLTATSSPKAAAILMAKNPRKMLLRGENHYSFQHGMQIPLTIPSRAVSGALHYNLDLVEAAAGYAIVPILAYEDKDGQAKFLIGPPGSQTLKNLIAQIR